MGKENAALKSRINTLFVKKPPLITGLKGSDFNGGFMCLSQMNKDMFGVFAVGFELLR